MGVWLKKSVRVQLQFLSIIDAVVSVILPHNTVYGPENVTSGASSDLKQATRTARAMVKVSALTFDIFHQTNLRYLTWIDSYRTSVTPALELGLF